MRHNRKFYTILSQLGNVNYVKGVLLGFNSAILFLGRKLA
tara:strand:+ start:448 stop:567 length:120 start_codon:yes stop_codon:yes gene_type:complete